MNILKMSVKNLFRYKRRTLITMSAIAVALIFYIFMDSLMGGWYNSTEREYVDYEVADGRIIKTAWWSDRDRLPLSESIDNPEEITSILEDLNIDYTVRTEFVADMVFYEDPFPTGGFVPIKVTAIDPLKDGEIFNLVEALNYKDSEGRLFAEGEEGVVIGNSLADKLGAELGYSVRLQGNGKGGIPVLIDATIIGIVKSDSMMVNFNGVFIPLDVADFYLEMEDAVTFISIKSSIGRKGKNQIKELKKRLPEDYSLLGYEEVAVDFMALKQSKDGFISIFFVIIAIIAIVGVNNTMMMAVFERRKEIGMMRAQGFSEIKIAWMFFFEAMGIGVFGSIIGLSLGALLNVPMVNIGIDYGVMLQQTGDGIDFGGMAMPSVFKGIWNFQTFLIGGGFTIFVSLLAAIMPTVRILKKSIPENLRTN